MGWKGADSDTSEIKQSCDSGWAGGCFSFKMSRTRQFGLDGSIWSFSWRLQPCWCPVINLRAALVFPSNIKLAKDLTNWESEMFVERGGKQLWIAQPSLIRSPILPSCQSYRRCSSMVECSLGLEVQEGFCNNKLHAKNTALSAIDSRAEPSPTARNNRASSDTNCLPTEPRGTSKLFFFQWTTSW